MNSEMTKTVSRKISMIITVALAVKLNNKNYVSKNNRDKQQELFTVARKY